MEGQTLNVVEIFYLVCVLLLLCKQLVLLL